MAVELRTSRGIYKLALAREAERDAGALVLVLGIERADGIEKVLLQFRIAAGLLAAVPPLDQEALLERLASWLAREFEQTREAALKAVRAEGTLFEIVFDQSNPGPF